MNEPKILVIVLQAKYEPWISIFKSGSSKTWLTNIPPNTSVIQVTGIPVPSFLFRIDEAIFKMANKNRLSRVRARIPRRTTQAVRFNFAANKFSDYFGFPSWRIRIPDLRGLSSHKTIAYLKASLGEEWDYLVTTNSSTYLDLKAIISYLKTSPRSNFAAGLILERVGPGLRPQTFLHGCYRIFSRDIVETICRSKIPRKIYYPEDAFIGDILAASEIVYSPLTICENYNQISNVYIPVCVAQAYRCKSGSNDLRHDIAIMNSVHEWINK